jgi:hypothetical protein
LAASAFATTPTRTYTFPARLHNYPLTATLSVYEEDHTWQVDFVDATNGEEQMVPHPPKMSFGGTYTDEGNERTFATDYAHAKIVFKRSGNVLTWERASVHFEMEKTPVNPN